MSVPQEQRWQADNFTLHEWQKPSLHGRKSQDQNRDRDWRVPRPRPRPTLWGSKTKTETETRGFQDQDQDQDSEVPRPRPRPRLVKTGLETSRDQDWSLENSKSAFQWAQDEHHTLSLSPQRVARKCKVSKIWTISCNNSEMVRDRMSVTINH